MGRKQIPRRHPRKEEIRHDYVKGLAQRETSGTTKGKRDITADAERTDYKEKKIERPALEVSERKFSIPQNFYYIVKIVVIFGAIASALFTAGVMYSNINNKIGVLERDVDFYKQESIDEIRRVEKNIKDDLRHLNDRIDNYMSEPKKE